MNFSEQGGFYFNTPNQLDSTAEKDKKRPARLQSVVPVAIRQLKDSSEDEFKLFGLSTQILSIVGILKDHDVQTTKATYQIEDHTGSITAIWWLENDSGTNPKLPDVQEQSYVRIFGSMRVQEGQKMIMVLRMHPVKNINEVTSHLLQVIHARLEAEAMARGRGIKADMKSMIKSNNPGADLVNSMMNVNDLGMHEAAPSMGTLENKLFKYLQTATSKHGYTRQTIYTQFSTYPQRDVAAALDFLITEGHAYTTIDTDHFMTSVDYN